MKPSFLEPGVAGSGPRALAAALLGLLVTGSLASAQSLVVPNEIQQPGTQPGESSLESASRCGNCHGGYNPNVEPSYLWLGSAMAQAGRDPLYWATVAIAEQDFPGAGDLCLRCHAPDGWIEGRSTPTDGSALTAADADGVACDLCHRMVDPDGSEHAGIQNPPFEAFDDSLPPKGYYGGGMFVLHSGSAKLGPYTDPVARHQAMPSSFHRESAFCGTCHDVSNPAVGDLAPNNGAPEPLASGTFSGVLGAPVGTKAAFNNFPHAYGVVERTYSEHVASGLDDYPVSGYDSLPAELQAGAIKRARDAAYLGGPNGNYADGAPRTFTCQTCHMRPLQGKGCNKSNAPLRPDLPMHDLTGGNTWIAKAIQYLDDQGDLVLGGGLTTLQRNALDAGVLRARQNLRDAAKLELDGNTLRVINLTGHKLISGYPEGRRMWLRVRWMDGFGATIREDGAYETRTVMHRGEALEVPLLLRPKDPRTHVYDVHAGITQDWASALVGLGFDPGLPVAFHRRTGAVLHTLGSVAASPPGTVQESFHFALNNRVVRDARIPPYGMDYDEAVQRNIRPVPASQYGAPGPGGTYDHFDVIELDPPLGAASAAIDLLYQTTSWEYVQFLDLANEGTVSHLADTGEHLLEAWMATGQSAPEVMASLMWTAPKRDGSFRIAPGTPEPSVGS